MLFRTRKFEIMNTKINFKNVFNKLVFYKLMYRDTGGNDYIFCYVSDLPLVTLILRKHFYSFSLILLRYPPALPEVAGRNIDSGVANCFESKG